MSGFKELFSFAWAHFRRGYGMGTAFILGFLSSLNTIIILLKLFIPSFSLFELLLIYMFSIIGVIILSILFDFVLLYLGFIQKEYFIGTRDNPTINIPIGAKEILNYEAQVFQLGFQIEATKLQIEISKALGIDASRLEQLLPKLEEYKTKFEELLRKAVR